MGALPLVLLGRPALCAAQAAYPDQRIALIVPYPAGGRTDVIGRLFADHLKSHVRQPVVTMNIAGVGGVLGAREVARARPDGYVLGVFSSGFVVTQYTTPGAPTLDEYDAIAQINVDPAGLAVRTESPYRRLADLVAYGRQHPRALKVGVTFGASSHVFAVAFARTAGIAISYVPFKGDPETLTALAGGHIDVAVSVPGAVRGWVEHGSVRMLAVAADKRVAGHGNAPTFRDDGLDLVMGSWHGLVGPKGLPPAVVELLAAASERVVTDVRFLERAARLPTSIEFRRQAEFAAFLKEEDQRIKELVGTLGLSAAPSR